MHTTLELLLAESDVDGLARARGAFDAEMVNLTELQGLSWVDLDDPCVFDAEMVELMGHLPVHD